MGGDNESAREEGSGEAAEEVPQADYALARAKAAIEEAERREREEAEAAAARAAGRTRRFGGRFGRRRTPEVTPGVTPEVTPEPVVEEVPPEPAPEPVAEEAAVVPPEPEPEPAPEPEPEPEPEPHTESDVEPDTEPDVEAGITAKADAKADAARPTPAASATEEQEERPRDKKAERAEKRRTPPKEPAGPSEIPEQSKGLVRAMHPRHAVVAGLAVAVAAYVSGRPLREVAVAGAAVLVVQVILGLVNDAGDEEADRTSGAERKPVAEGHLPAANATFVASCLAIVAVPLSLQNGWVAALSLLAYLVLALGSRTGLRRSWLSWVPWAASFAALPAFLAYGGWGAGRHGAPPTWEMTAAVAALGIGVHVALALPHLVADNKTGTRHLPLRLALKVGAGPLLVVTVVYLVAAVAAIVVVALGPGLRQ